MLGGLERDQTEALRHGRIEDKVRPLHQPRLLCLADRPDVDDRCGQCRLVRERLRLLGSGGAPLHMWSSEHQCSRPASPGQLDEYPDREWPVLVPQVGAEAEHDRALIPEAAIEAGWSLRSMRTRELVVNPDRHHGAPVGLEQFFGESVAADMLREEDDVIGDSARRAGQFTVTEPIIAGRGVGGIVISDEVLLCNDQPWCRTRTQRRDRPACRSAQAGGGCRRQRPDRRRTPPEPGQAAERSGGVRGRLGGHEHGHARRVLRRQRTDQLEHVHMGALHRPGQNARVDGDGESGHRAA